MADYAKERELVELRRELDAMKQLVGAMTASAQGKNSPFSGRSSYVLSDADRERAEATKARDAELSRRTGARPLGGFSTSTSVGATDRNFQSGQAFDTVSNGIGPVSNAGSAGSGSAGSGLAQLHPFSLYDASSGGALNVGVRFGMVNTIVPTIGGQPITTPNLTINTPSSGFILLGVTTDAAGRATSAAIAFAATVPLTTATLGIIALGAVTVTPASGGAPASLTISQSVSGSLWHQRCGPDTHQFGSV